MTRIRLATLDDMPQMLRLGAAMHAESRFGAYVLNEKKAIETAQALIDNAAAGCVLLALCRDAGVVGMLAGHVADYFFTDVRIAQDKWFYVVPEYRGSSAALKLLIAFRRWAENRQARELCINMSVDIDQERFNRFMVHLKFKSCGSNFVLNLSTSVTAANN